MRKRAADKARTFVFFIDPIEQSSFPVTETGYALVHRAWSRARATKDRIYVAYPETNRTWGRPYILSHQILDFSASPAEFYRSQREVYRAGADADSKPCHRQSAVLELPLRDVDAVVFRQEHSDPTVRRQTLEGLARVERDTVVYLSPTLALRPELGSKVLPEIIDPSRTPRTLRTDRVEEAIRFIRSDLDRPETVIVKPLHGDNGVGVRILGTHPVRDVTGRADDRPVLEDMIEALGSIIVQEYLPSVRRPDDLGHEPIGRVAPDRRDFGEIRFIVIDGKIPRTEAGTPILVARRVPADDSLLADSGISHPTSLSAEEQSFIEEVGAHYVRWGVHFGGGDLIRTPDPDRPFLFTDAAQSVCGHAVVTGILNGAPYLIVDQVLDSIDRQIDDRASHRLRRETAVG